MLHVTVTPQVRSTTDVSKEYNAKGWYETLSSTQKWKQYPVD